MTSREVIQITGIRDISEVCRYARGTYLYSGRYRITREELKTEKGQLEGPIAEEWDEVTEQLRKKIIWYKTMGKGVRKIVLRTSAPK